MAPQDELYAKSSAIVEGMPKPNAEPHSWDSKTNALKQLKDFIMNTSEYR